MNARTWKTKHALHRDTPGGLNAAWKRGQKLAESGAGELQLNEALSRCKSPDMASQLKAGYYAALESSHLISRSPTSTTG
jgi:hypothetical protein